VVDHRPASVSAPQDRGESMTGPMDGVRVLEAAQFTFVPAAGAVLADWGADVIKVEHAERGDAQRGLIRVLGSGDRQPGIVFLSHHGRSQPGQTQYRLGPGQSGVQAGLGTAGGFQ
jgi:hypothetical protein